MTFNLTQSQLVTQLPQRMGLCVGWVWVGDIDVIAAIRSSAGSGDDAGAGEDGFHDSDALNLDGLGLAGLAHCRFVERKNLLAESKARLSTVTIHKTTDGGLSRSTLFTNLSLSQGAVFPNFGDKHFPIHAPMITHLRSIKALLRFSFRLRSENAH